MEAINSNSENIRGAIRQIMTYIGEDPRRDGLVDTPDRIVRMWKEIFRGYDPTARPKITTFENTMSCEDMIVDTGDYYSICEHHMLPFFGRYCFAYIPCPDGRILGISKIARVVGYCAAKLQLQERLAREIVDMLNGALHGKVQGMAIVMRGTHLCKAMRGARSNGEMTVAHFTGKFLDDKLVRSEFYRLMNNAL